MFKHIPSLFLLIGLLITSQYSIAHCDTKDGPVVAAAIKALEQNNINYVLIWVQPADETEIKRAFELTMKVRALSSDAQKLADNYFFETLVRVHRAGEGMPYTGIKPSGTPVDEKIVAADESIALGNLSPLNDLVPKDTFTELQKLFGKLMSLKNYDVNNVQVGREYIEAYVQFFHLAEGEGEHNPGFIAEEGHSRPVPWILAGIFFITSVLLGLLYYRKNKV